MNDRFIIAISRHGQTDSNVSRLWVGRRDDELNERGKEQAKALAEDLKGYNFDFVISSDKKRAIETAKIVSRELEIPYWGAMEILRDRDYGEVEGLSSEQILSKFGIWMTNALSPELDNIKGAEKVMEIYDRVRNFVDLIKKRFEGRSMVVVAHGSFVRAFYELYVGDPGSIKFTNCSSFILNFSDGRAELLRDVVILP